MQVLPPLCSSGWQTVGRFRRQDDGGAHGFVFRVDAIYSIVYLYIVQMSAPLAVDALHKFDSAKTCSSFYIELTMHDCTCETIRDCGRVSTGTQLLRMLRLHDYHEVGSVRLAVL